MWGVVVCDRKFAAHRRGREMLRRIAQKARSVADAAALDFRIRMKWNRDRKTLPLTSKHRELYDISHRFLWKELGRFPNLIDCDDFNDRIQWVKLFDQRIETVMCTDKVRLRDHVRECLGAGYCPELFQVHDKFEDIDFDALPDRFVIKANHDYGSVLVVKDKQSLDMRAANDLFSSALSRPFGWDRGEWAYSFIPRKVFVEEFIGSGDLRPPPDYKFLCVDGSVKFLHYLYDRDSGLKEQVIDLEGNDPGVRFFAYVPYGSGFTMPGNWKEMISCAEKLSKGWKFVRVDLYSVNGKIYVGEMTFFPAGGAYPGDGQAFWGKMLDFDRTTFLPPIVPALQSQP
ncbi:MAG: hypothetical protein G4V63_16855 [Candidatus Afipia apatlaquensis]|uniref:Glycosyl transferase n=1 Tax=Candidatus Afipia apatlaquensis TaxID=2712852 RepID=A0A7C9RGZ3_9BRAD|nr:hypothetical protein [Candidatus Afipia apatlaquensis]